MTNEDRVTKFISELKDAPAFPMVMPADTIGVAEGLSKREWMATHLLSAILSTNALLPEITKDGNIAEYLSKAAVVTADALIAELAKPKETK